MKRLLLGALAAAGLCLHAACSDSDPTGPDGNECGLRGTLVTGTPVGGELAPGDCTSNGTFLDHYNWSALADQAVQITLTSAAFDPLLLVSNGPATVPVAQNSDAAPGNPNSLVKLIAALGPHTVTATTLSANATGAYVLSVTTTAESAENCETVFIELGANTTQNLAPTDCMLFSQFFDDQFRAFVTAGTRVRLTMHSTEFDTFLQVYAPSGAFLAEDDDSGGGGSSQIVFTAPVSGFFIISASSALSGETGEYSLALELAPATSSSVAPTVTRGTQYHRGEVSFTVRP